MYTSILKAITISVRYTDGSVLTKEFTAAQYGTPSVVANNFLAGIQLQDTLDITTRTHWSVPGEAVSVPVKQQGEDEYTFAPRLGE